MAFRWIHVLRRYDEKRGGFFYLYRFPFNEKLNDDLKRNIHPKKDRFFYPKTKAWHVAERHADVAETIILKHTGLHICAICHRGDFCKAWTHLAGSSWADSTPPGQEWEHVQDDRDSHWEDVNAEWSDPPWNEGSFYGQHHWETDEERYRAQERYQQWVNEQAARRAQERAQYGQRTHDPNMYGRAWEHAAREQARQQAEWESEQQRRYYESLFGKELPPTEDQRWYDPGKRRDSKWAMRVMGLTRLPTKAELKSAFRRLVMKYHPDREDGSHNKMALINAAKDYLDAFIME